MLRKNENAVMSGTGGATGGAVARAFGHEREAFTGADM